MNPDENAQPANPEVAAAALSSQPVETTSVTPADMVGQPHGSEVRNILGELTGEVVIYEYDTAGTVIGWHKEIKQ